MRGIFGFLADHPAYKSLPKIWHVTTLHSDCFWWDMIVNPILVDNKNPIAVYLKNLKEEVEKTLERRFIYYFVSRPKVRFDLSRPPYRKLFTKDLVVNFLVGKSQKRVKVRIKPNNREVAKNIASELLSDKFIKFTYPNGNSEVLSVHDFIMVLEIELGLTSMIHYVGITKNPEDRPLSRKHRGVSDTLYNFSTEEHDFFLFMNLHRVIARSVDSNSPVSFMVGNSWMDEILVDPEGKIIEQSLILYFDSSIQKEDKPRAKSALENSLRSLKSERDISKIIFELEIESTNEYWNFYSERVHVARRHVFSFEADNDLVFKDLGNNFDVEEFFSSRW